MVVGESEAFAEDKHRDTIEPSDTDIVFTSLFDARRSEQSVTVAALCRPIVKEVLAAGSVSGIEWKEVA